MLKPFTIDELPNLAGGRERVRINNQIEAAVRDCINRPGLKAARKVKIEMELVPTPGEEGYCESVDTELVSAVSLPKSRSAPFTMKAATDADGTAEQHWNDERRDNPRQHTIDEMADKPGGGEGGTAA